MNGLPISPVGPVTATVSLRARDRPDAFAVALAGAFAAPLLGVLRGVFGLRAAGGLIADRAYPLRRAAAGGRAWLNRAGRAPIWTQMPSATANATRLASALLVLLTVLVVCAVWGVSSIQDLGQRLLTSMLDQETGLRGFAITRRESFLQPYVQGRQAFAGVLRDGRRTAR